MNEDVHQHIDEVLSTHENNACYVLITCDKSSDNERLKVEMTYGGDAVLAAYLVESAQTLLEHDIQNQAQA